jgi:cell division septation protein DedD
VIVVTSEGSDMSEGREHCSSEECGFTIFIDEREVYSFMEMGDYSSARELEHFREVGAQLEKRAREGEGLSLLALSASDNRLSRDFSVLQIAHMLGKHGKKVLIVDCDFLEPGLSGIVENREGLGFLDFLLYGSSLQSVAHSIGIDGVAVTGAGSFPVYKTMPFARKEFGKVNDFLTKKNDVVIYCSTLFTDEGRMNPMTRFTQGILFCCRIDEMEEGQLKKHIEELKELDASIDVICFSSKGVVPAGAGRAMERPKEGVGEKAAGEGEEVESVYIEKMGEIDMEEGAVKSRVSIPRIVTIVAAAIVATFIIWWVFTTRTIREGEDARRMTELVQKQRDARETEGEQSQQEETAPPEGEVEDDAGITPDLEPTETVEEIPQPVARFTVHIASFKNLDRAENEIADLEKLGYEVEAVEVEIKGITWLRIMAGRYATLEEAEQARIELLDLKRITYAKVVELDDE